MKKKSTVLRTERLVLKEYEEKDREKMISILRDERVTKTFMVPDISEDDKANWLFSKLMEFSVSENHFEYGIYLDGEIIGFLNDCDIDGGEIEVGYVISPEHWGKGYATEVLGAAIDELFNMGYERVTAGFFEENTASRRVVSPK